MVRELRLDFQRYDVSRWRLWLMPQIWTIVWYRLGHWLYKENDLKVFGILKPPYQLGYIFIEAFMQMRLDPSAEIGGGLFIGHSGGIHLHPDVVIGENCDIAHHVTIGTSAGGRKGVPRIGNSVYIGTGATVIGKIKVGDGARIAANTLVMTSVPAGATIMGVPGRLIAVPKHSTETGLEKNAPHN
jgi:serine O-acetyltransferase